MLLRFTPHYFALLRLGNKFSENYTKKKNTPCRKNAEFCDYTAGGTHCYQHVMSPGETSWKVGRPSIKKETGMWHWRQRRVVRLRPIVGALRLTPSSELGNQQAWGQCVGHDGYRTSGLCCACVRYEGTRRGELSYLVPLGSENVSAPYFKQCFFRGWGWGYCPPRLSQTPRLPVPRQK